MVINWIAIKPNFVLLQFLLKLQSFFGYFLRNKLNFRFFGILEVAVNGIEKLFIFLNRGKMLLRKLFFDFSVLSWWKMMLLNWKVVGQHFVERSEVFFGFYFFDLSDITVIDLLKNKTWFWYFFLRLLDFSQRVFVYNITDDFFFACDIFIL